MPPVRVAALHPAVEPISQLYMCLELGRIMIQIEMIYTHENTATQGNTNVFVVDGCIPTTVE